MKSKLFIVLVLISLISPVFGQVSFTANVTNPGTISEVIGDRVGITNLTVTGTIDARDFRVMRDMSLVSLDLSGATIAEFNGDAGYGWPIHYLANIIPNDALRFPTGNTTLASLKLPATITGIGNSAIASFQALTSITLPATLRYIDDYAFRYSPGLQNIDFSACTMLDSIGAGAFGSCPNLVALDLSKCTSLTKIESGAFQSCLGLKTVSLPSSLISLELSVFGSCSGLSSIDFSKCKSLKMIDDGVINGCSQLLNLDLSLCTSLDSIKGSAVSGCSSLQTVKLPSSLQYIGEGAFSLDTSLVTVDFLDCTNLKVIGKESFKHCYAIQKLDLSNCSALDSIAIEAFSNCNKIEEIDLPESIRTIGASAFYFWEDHLKIVRIKNPVPPKTEWVSFSTSTYGKNLAVLYVPDGAKKAYQFADGGGSWFGFSYIVEEVPGIKAKSIENSSAGNLNTQLTSYEKSTLTHLKIRGDIDARDFKILRDEMPALTEIDLVKSNIVEYSGTEGTVSENSLYPVYTIPSYAFCNPKTGISKNSLTSVYLPIITDKVGEYAFKGCSGLNLIEMQVLSIIGDYAFAACPNLSSFDFSKTEALKSIGNFAFSGCTKLNGELDFSSNSSWVGNIGQGAFFNCNKITSVKFPESSYLTTIADSAFMNCSGITSFDFPASTKTVGEKAFFNSGLKNSVTLPHDIDTIGYQAFSKCSGLTSFVIDGDNQWTLVYSSIDGVLFDETKTKLVACPNGKTGLYQVPDTVKTIGGYAFDQCTGLTGIELPLALKSIEKYGLKGCANLSSIKIYNPLPPDVGVKVFNGVNTGTCKLYVPKGSKTAYQAANQWKYFANIIEMEGNLTTEKTLNLTQAGTLSSLLTAAEKAAITKLTLTGNIDARDFKTMRDGMPNLTDIDLLKTTIVSYTGNEGTAGNYLYSYNDGTIPIDAFRSMGSLKNIVFPEKATAIDDSAFYGCKNLVNIYFNALLKTIGPKAFYNCSSLRFVYILASLTSIGEGAFSYTKNLVEFEVSEGNLYFSAINGVLFNKARSILVAYPAANRDSYIIPNGVLSIANSAFSGNDHINNLTFPFSLKKIGAGAFGSCSNLSLNEFPKALEDIGIGAFSNCEGIKAFAIENGNVNFACVDGILYNKSLSKLIAYPIGNINTSYVMPNSVDSIYDGAFSGSKILSSITLSKELLDIGTGAFSGCTSLTSVDLSGSKLVSIKEIGFNNCSSILTVKLPASLKVIGSWAFSSCSKLSVIEIKNPIPPDLSAKANVFNSVNKSTCTLYVPKGSKSAYQTANQWKDFVNIVEMEGGLTTEKTLNLTQAGTLSSLLSAAEKVAVTKLTLTGNIDARDFKTMRDEMPALVDLSLLNSTIVLYYGSGGTNSLDYTTYPANEVPANSFYKHQNLSKVILPSTAIKIGQTAFRACSNLKMVEIPSSVFVIDAFAFYQSHKVELVLISVNVTTIGACAFSDCSATIVVDANNPDFSSINGILYNKGQSVLIQVPSIVSGVYSIPSTVKTVQHDAFLACSQLTSIIIPSSVQAIEEYAFAYCTGLTSIKIYSAIPLDISAVWDATLEGINFSACTLYVPKGSKAAYQTSLGWKEFTNIVEMEGGVSSDVKLNLTQAGTLSSLLTAAEKAAIIKLTLTGNIDARDFRTMRDEMPGLEDVDLSHATIVEYIGTLGTVENESTTYVADAFPLYSFSFPTGVKSLKLESIVFPGNLKSIGYHAFYNSCPGLTSIAIPKYVEMIEDGAFSYCNQIKEFIVSVDNEHLTSINGVVFSKDISELIVYPGAIEGSYEVPQKVKRIANTAFEGKWKLTSVQLPEGLEEIGNIAFNSCPLEFVNFPESLVFIGNSAFTTCTKLTAIDLSKCSKLTSLNRNTFNYCTSLSEVKLPLTITYIDSLVFRDCNKLSLFTVKNSIPPGLGTNVFLNANTSRCVLYVPLGSKAAYQAANQWKDFYTIRELDFTGNEIYPELSSWKVYSSNGQLVVEGCDRNSLVAIFSITGQKIFEGKSESNSMRIDLKKNQAYIFRVNNESKKIVHQ